MISHTRTWRAAIGLALLGVAAAGTASVRADGPTVAIDNFAFTPATITVPIGATVVWTNRDDIPHTVTSATNPRLFRSKPLDTGDRFTATFAKAGRYGYFCSLHPHMQGTVLVQ